MSPNKNHSEKSQTRRATQNFALAGLFSFLAIGCATAPVPAELVSARENYEVAAADPMVVEHAPVPLLEASRAVEQAEAAHKAKAKPDEVLHLTMLASKRVEIAEADAQARALEKNVAADASVIPAQPQPPAGAAAAQPGLSTGIAAGPTVPDSQVAEQSITALKEANAAAARQVIALQATNQNAEQSALELQAINALAETQALELQAANEAFELQSAEIRVKNDLAEAQVLTALEASRPAEAKLSALERANQAAEQEIVALQNAIMREEEAALRHQAGAEAAALRAQELEASSFASTRLELTEQAAIENQERAALALRKAEESSEYQRSQLLYEQEVEARRVLQNQQRAQENAQVAAATVRENEAQVIERTERVRSDAERRAAELEIENQKLRAANAALLDAVSASTPAPAPAPARASAATAAPAPAPVRQATERASTPPDAEIREQPLKRDLVVVAQGPKAGASPDAASANAELEEALSAERARTAQLENERAQLQEWNARLVPGGIILTLNDIFAFNEEEPSPDAQASLNRLAILLNERPERRILVEGHTDAAGAEEYNLALSQKRADAVRQYLQNQGVSESRIDAAGVGEKSPVAPNNTAAGRRQNRRVEVRIQDPTITATDG